MIELKAFVTATLNQIVGGIEDFENDQSEGTAAVNPTLGHQKFETVSSSGYFLGVIDQNQTLIMPVDFDVAITTEEIEGVDGGASIKVMGMSVGGSLSDKVKSAHESRIKFRIPLGLPTK